MLLFQFLDLVIFYFMYISVCLHVCLYVHHVRAVPEGARRGASDLLEVL